jgi:hypothetical protein
VGQYYDQDRGGSKTIEGGQRRHSQRLNLVFPFFSYLHPRNPYQFCGGVKS